MKHALRKYLSSGGSALFMVISTMAALMVLITAMYLSVVSSRTVQFTIFNQDQAYVSAASLTDMMMAAVMSPKGSSQTKLSNDVLKLNVGESMNANDPEMQLGNSGFNFEGDVTLTRLANEGDNYVYDIAITVKNNGVAETTHTYIIYSPATPEAGDMGDIDQFFTGTGYLPNDIWMSSIRSDSTLYFDNEYTVFSEHVNSNTFGGDGSFDLKMDVTCAGSLYFNMGNMQTSNVSKPLTWCIGNNFTIGNRLTTGLKYSNSSSDRGMIIVGGDFIYNTNWLNIDNADIFVFGDVQINGGLNRIDNLYVAGTLEINTTNTVQIGHVYLGSSAQIVGPNGGGAPSNLQTTVGVWEDSSADLIEDYLDLSIGVSVYPKWKIDALELGDPVDIVFNSHYENPTYITYIGDDCVLGRIYDLNAGVQAYHLTIVIDTGDDPENVRKISVTPNCSDGKTFRWRPDDSNLDAKLMNVVVVGQGSLVIDVPDGVTYEATNQEFFGHIGWYMILGGEFSTNGGGPSFNRGGNFTNMVVGDVNGSTGMAALVDSAKFIINDVSTPCEYEQPSGSKYYVCKKHDYTVSADAAENYDPLVDRTLCAGHIDRDSIDSYYASHPDVLNNVKKYYTDYFGAHANGNSGYSDDCYYPNVNIFVESCLENADIQMGVASDRSALKQNIFFGYVYAPYMTFVSIGDGAGMKALGGMIVSDVQINGAYIYKFAKPDRTIEEIIGEDMDGVLTPAADRSWRFHGR